MTRRMFTVNPDLKEKDVPLYRTAAVLGVGLIGGSLALAFRRSGLVGRILGVSRKATIKKALQAGVIDQGYIREDFGLAIEQADPGGVSWTKRISSLTRWSWSALKPAFSV